MSEPTPTPKPTADEPDKRLRDKVDKLLASDFPDVQKFADLLGFGLFPATPSDVDRFLRDEAKRGGAAKKKKKANAAKAPRAKPKAAKTRSKRRAKSSSR